MICFHQIIFSILYKTYVFSFLTIYSLVSSQSLWYISHRCVLGLFWDITTSFCIILFNISLIFIAHYVYVTFPAPCSYTVYILSDDHNMVHWRLSGYISGPQSEIWHHIVIVITNKLCSSSGLRCRVIQSLWLSDMKTIASIESRDHCQP